MGLFTRNSDKLKSGLTHTCTMNILRMLKGIPVDLMNIFAPNTADELVQFELNVAKFRAREKERAKVMYLQKQHKLPLRPNQSLKDVVVRVRIKQLCKEKNDSEDRGFYSV